MALEKEDELINKDVINFVKNTLDKNNENDLFRFNRLKEFNPKLIKIKIHRTITGQISYKIMSKRTFNQFKSCRLDQFLSDKVITLCKVKFEDDFEDDVVNICKHVMLISYSTEEEKNKILSKILLSNLHSNIGFFCQHCIGTIDMIN